MFARWVWTHAGVAGPLFTTNVARGVGLWGQQQGLFKARPSNGIGNPLPGDIVVYGAPAAQTGGHVAIVESVNANGTINTINGNFNNDVEESTNLNPVTATAGGDNLHISGYVSPPGA
jgi:hypothetical protein